MIFIGLEGGKIALHPEGCKKRKFDRTDHEGIGNYLAELQQWGGFQCSSSVNHPEEYGFPRSFDIDKVVSKAVEHAYMKLAVRLEPQANAAEALEKASAERKHKFPLSVLFLKSARDGKDVLLTFHGEPHFDMFVAGVRYGTRMALKAM